MKYIYILLPLLLLGSCDLLQSEDEGFQCEKNAPIQVSGQDRCANAIGRNHRIGAYHSYEKLDLQFNGDFTIHMQTDTGRITTKKYDYPGEVSLWFQEINKGGSGYVTITTFDTINRIISGRFDLTAEGAHNYQAYDYHVTGTFNKVRF